MTARLHTGPPGYRYADRLLSGGTACYQAVLPKSIVGHRLREKGRRRRGKEERRKKYLLSPRCPRSRVIVTLARRRNVSPRVEKDRDDTRTGRLLTSFNSCRFHLRGNQSYKILPPYRFSLITTVSLSLLCQKRYSI
ncbi:hypothetical protein GW17_00013327 [Ensete ventricosum]|nr:hypothetical protein GW17_00013327 [Ensete ventricosum]